MSTRYARTRACAHRAGAILALACVLYAAAVPAAGADRPLAFPGAVGWAAHTPGGHGGAILRVTTLAESGPGSLRAAIETAGPRIVVFEVGGVIDLAKTRLAVTEPFLTIAGQTAPAPGITLIRGGIVVSTHDVVVRHIAVRAGSAETPRMGGWDIDTFSTQAGARDVIVDHCSFTWATDENLSASGARFEGADPDAWRERMSHRITYSNNLIAEGLAESSHSKGEHSKGTLVHDNASDILIIGNLYAHNYERSPMFKGGARGMVVNNLIYNPGPRAVHYNLIAEEWIEHPYEVGKLALIGNVLRAGPSTPPDLAFFMLGGSGDLELYRADNLAVDRIGQPLPQLGFYTTGRARLVELEQRPALPPGVVPLAAIDVQDAVIREAGARPWDRDPIDRRIVADTIEGRGRIIDDQSEVGGYPVRPQTQRAFVPAEWNLDDMSPRTPHARSAPPR